MDLASSPTKSEFCGNSATSSVSCGSGELWLLLAQGGQRQQNLSERPEVPAARRDDRELLNPFASVAADSGEAEEEPLVQRLAPDQVIRRAQHQVGVGGVRRDLQQFLGVAARVADHAQAVQLVLLDQRGIVGLQA